MRGAPFFEVMPTLITGPLCGMCAVVKGWLAELGVAYRETDITADVAARRLVRRLAHGYVSVPTLVFEDGAALIEPRRDAVVRTLRERHLIR